MSRAATDRINRLVVLGYLLAASMPPAGLVMGIVLAIPSTKIRSKHGVWIIATSIVAAVVWAVIISSGALNTPNTDF
jgi:4-amino-4-deoxy-L-arabinose transferase-like glycosyltransferase